MTLKSKICGITTSEILKYIINHKYPAELLGFIINYKKSPRYVGIEILKKLINFDKKNSKYVAVLVKPDHEILEKIKDLNFDFYQIYDSDPKKIKFIKNKYNKKIITAITIKNREDVSRYKNFREFSDIILFDGPGYEKSVSFNHQLLDTVPGNICKMVAGNIQFDDDIDKFKKICNYIDASGGLETKGLKDISKIDIFLNNIKRINNED
tara:strand:- start:5 stop:634 length:630 start_codon:yes stop_codon:yes gene_type:complete